MKCNKDLERVLGMLGRKILVKKVQICVILNAQYFRSKTM